MNMSKNISNKNFQHINIYNEGFELKTLQNNYIFLFITDYQRIPKKIVKPLK